MGPGVSGSLCTQGLELMRICPLSHLASQVALGMEKEYKKEKRGKRNPQEVFGFFFFQTREALLLLLHTPIPLARTQQCGHAHLPGSWASSLAMFPERKGKSLPQVGALVSILHRRK